MAKCAKCNKIVTKKSPGLQCSKCSKWLHSQCAAITTEQLNTLFATDSVDWKCRTCNGPMKPKRLSCILPDAEDEDNTDTENQQSSLHTDMMTRQILGDIRKEVRTIIREELQTTLQFYSDKIDDYEEKILTYEQKMKTFENQNENLRNTCKNLQLKTDVLEQKLNGIEQSQLINHAEICGIKEEKKEDLDVLVKSVCTKLELDVKEIIKMYRKRPNRINSSRKPQESASITIVLRDGCRDKWLKKARESKISTKDLGRTDEAEVFMRETLAPSTAYLLWKTKTDLKINNSFKYVWCRQGTVMARKEENGPYHIIRSVNDIDKLIAATTCE